MGATCRPPAAPHLHAWGLLVRAPGLPSRVHSPHQPPPRSGRAHRWGAYGQRRGSPGEGAGRPGDGRTPEQKAGPCAHSLLLSLRTPGPGRDDETRGCHSPSAQLGSLPPALVWDTGGMSSSSLSASVGGDRRGPAACAPPDPATEDDPCPCPKPGCPPTACHPPTPAACLSAAGCAQACVAHTPPGPDRAVSDGPSSRPRRGRLWTRTAWALPQPSAGGRTGCVSRELVIAPKSPFRSRRTGQPPLCQVGRVCAVPTRDAASARTPVTTVPTAAPVTGRASVAASGTPWERGGRPRRRGPPLLGTRVCLPSPKKWKSGQSAP